MSEVPRAAGAVPDQALTAIADYACGPPITAEPARRAAGLCLLDAVGCALLAADHPEATRHLAPWVPGAVLPGGARVPGTDRELDPVRAAHATGALIRWLDYNDTWLAAEWGHPSDNLAALLACADYLDRGVRPVGVAELLDLAIRAYEIQGVLALENAFNRRGFDHVILVRVASAACATRLLGGDRRQVLSAVSNAWLDGAPLRDYRQAPDTGWRKSWAAGDAAARAVQHALMARAGEMGYPHAVTAPRWGVQDALLGGEPLRLPRPFGTYVVEQVLFKVDLPVEFHAQTAVECALRLHGAVADPAGDIQEIGIDVPEAAARIIDKAGPLTNPADRDHCLQYAVAVALLHGALRPGHFDDATAADPRIDGLRARTRVRVEPGFTRAYHDPQRRAIAARVTLRLRDGRRLCEHVDYPLGHPRRRAEARPRLRAKLERALRTRLPAGRHAALLDLFDRPLRLAGLRVGELMEMLRPPPAAP